MPAQYHIGTPSKKWGSEEKSQWLAEQNKKDRINKKLKKRF